jgi:hypothetical protein
MKLRIKGNSLRFRLTKSEVADLLIKGRVEDTVVYGSTADARLTYAVQQSATAEAITSHSTPQTVSVLIPVADVRRWVEGESVGIYGSLDTGAGLLALLVEKDFACLDRSDVDNADTFPNPLAAAMCRTVPEAE